jgi:hypothetical protein
VDADHIEQLARLWRVDPMTIPHWAPPTHAMQIFRYVEQWCEGETATELAWLRTRLKQAAPQTLVVA